MKKKNLLHCLVRSKFQRTIKKVSLSRNMQSNDAEFYRPIGEIEDELKAMEDEATNIDTELKTIFEKLGI
jgi:hypothetical protein